jgi:hypothetical protein
MVEDLFVAIAWLSSPIASLGQGYQIFMASPNLQGTISQVPEQGCAQGSLGPEV